MAAAVAPGFYIWLTTERSSQSPTSSEEAADSVQPSGWRVFESASQGFRIRYPADYLVTETDVVRLSDPNGNDELVIYGECPGDPSGGMYKATRTTVTFHGRDAKQLTYRDDRGALVAIIIQATFVGRCFTFELHPRSGDPEALRDIADTFEY